MRNGKRYYEVDYTTLYNFIKTEGLRYSELSEMIGRDQSFISGVLTQNRKVPEDILDKLCDLMGKTREEVIAHEDSVFNTTLVVDKKEEEEWKPFEERMADMIRTDPERRHKFEMSEAYRNELEKGNDVIGNIMNGKNEFKEKWGRLVDCVCEALKDGRQSISIVELVQLMVKA